MSWRWAPLAARCRREKKDRRNGWRVEPATSPQDPDPLPPPDPDGPPVSPLIRGRMNRGNVAFAGNSAHRRRHLTWVAPRRLMPSCGWPSLAAEVFPSTTRRSMRLRGIVGERPIVGSAVGAGCFCRSSIKVRAPCAASVPGRLQEGADDERGPAPESSRNGPYERADRAGIMQAYALLAAVRGAFGAGVSRT